VARSDAMQSFNQCPEFQLMIPIAISTEAGFYYRNVVVTAK